MSSTSMNGVYTCTLGARPVVTRPIKSGRVVACNASKKDTLSKIAGAAAAAQIALILPFAGVAVAQPHYDLAFGEDLKAQAKASDVKTNNEPTFSDISKSLSSQFGQSNSANDVGRAIKENTPSPQGIVQGAKDAGKKLNNATNDLGNVFDDLTGKAQDAVGGAAGSAKSAVGDVKGSAKSATGNVAGDVKSAAGNLKGAAASAGRQVDQATPDLSFGEDLKAEAQASDAKTSAEPTFSDIGKSLNAQFGNKSADDVGKAIKDNTPSAQGIVQGAKDAGKKLNKAADLSNVFDDLLGKAQDASSNAAGAAKSTVGDVKGSAKSAAGNVAGDVKAAAGDVKGAAKSTARQIDEATPNLSFGGLEEIIGKAQNAAGDAAGSAKSAVGGVKGNASSAAGDVASSAKQAGGEIKGQAKNAGRQLDQATPDLSGVFDGLVDQGKSVVKDVKDNASKKADDVASSGDINAGAKRVVGEADAIAKSAGKRN